jgi:hypothetical protein
VILTKEKKEELVELLKSIDIKEVYSTEDEQKRKWFRFGAYDALRMATEAIIKIPEEDK